MTDAGPSADRQWESPHEIPADRCARRGLNKQVEEFEAESVPYLVCARLGIEIPSDTYLAGYLDNHAEVPNISIDLVMKSAGVIEQIGKGRMKHQEKKP